MKTNQDSRLRQLRKDSGKQVDAFAEQFGISAKTQTAYENGTRVIPWDYAVKVCNEYSVTLDWLSGRSESRNGDDLMLGMIFALDRIFKISYKTTVNPYNKYENRELTLWVDKTFREYLREISELQDAQRMNRQITNELYQASRAKIQEKYKECFQKLLGIANSEINEDGHVNIEAVEEVDFLKYLAY